MEVAGLLIAGGQKTSHSVEVFLPSTGSQCFLPSLPGTGKVEHLQSGNVLCGGLLGDDCVTWSHGGWQETASVLSRRGSGLAGLEEGILVLGGVEGSDLVDTGLVIRDDFTIGETLPFYVIHTMISAFKYVQFVQYSVKKLYKG